MQIAVLMESYLEQRSMDRAQEAADRDAAFKRTAAKMAQKIKGFK